MVGTRGPVGKRSDQRRRRNKDEHGPVTTADGAPVVKVPRARPGWHPVARSWFRALAESGQSTFYEPSDWQLAVLLAEQMSRELAPKPVMRKGDDGEPVESLVDRPINASSLSAILRGMETLLVSEGARRRARVELVRPRPDDAGDDAGGTVSYLDHARRARPV